MSGSRRKTNQSPSSRCVDRISDLPKNVIEHIFEKLEIRDVVRTSVLSNKWRQNWTSLSQLTFSHQFAAKYNHCFENVISKVLLQHVGPISMFSLTMPVGLPNASDMIIPWISFLSNNGIRILTLVKNDNDVQLLRLPNYFFSCSKLRVLSLSACLFKTPSSFNGFRSLISFICYRITFEGLCFKSLISRCPLLQELTLDSCTGLEHVLSIEVPSLRVFVIYDFHDVDFISFKNTQNLSSLSIYIQNHGLPTTGTESSFISEFFNCLPKLENLTLHGRYIAQMLARGAVLVPFKLSSSLNFLKDLRLKEFDLCNLDALSCLLCIVRSSPNLQLLDISAHPCIRSYLSSSYEDQLRIFFYLEVPRYFVYCSLDCLYNIKVRQIYGNPPEMLLIKILLATSPSLKNMVIQIHPSVTEKTLWISKELLKYRRASTSAEVTLI